MDRESDRKKYILSLQECAVFTQVALSDRKGSLCVSMNQISRLLNATDLVKALFKMIRIRKRASHLICQAAHWTATPVIAPVLSRLGASSS